MITIIKAKRAEQDDQETKKATAARNRAIFMIVRGYMREAYVREAKDKRGPDEANPPAPTSKVRRSLSDTDMR